jgi:NAD(P)-dependent dehydrogenase (short-subunit alcohol dehydrogenase family)
MVANGGGVIINMSSQMGNVGSERDRTVYVMTKHAIEGLTKALELALKGVSVVSICTDLCADPVDATVFRRPRDPQMDPRPHPARPRRHSREGGTGGRVLGFSRR